LQPFPSGAGLETSLEWWRGNPLPLDSACDRQLWVQFDMVDSDEPEIMPIPVALELVETEGELRHAYRAALTRWALHGLQQKHTACVLWDAWGAGVGGVWGRVGVSAIKILSIIILALWCLTYPMIQCKAVLMLLGRMLSVFEHRRP